MGAIPITINGGGSTSENYSHSHGQFSYGYYDETDFSQMPEGYTWIPSYDYNQFNSPSSAYFIISTTQTELGGIISPIPTFHVSGSTDGEILHLINSLHSIKVDGIVWVDAYAAMRNLVFSKKLNNFASDLTNYKYTMFDTLLLNFDFGNLNCDVAEPNTGDSIYSLRVDDDGTIRYTLDLLSGSIDWGMETSDTCSGHRVFAGGGYFGLNTNGPLLSNLNSGSGSFMFAMRIRVNTPALTFDVLNMDNENCKLEIDTNVFRFVLGSDQVTITGRYNDWITLIFGRNSSNQIFIKDGFNTATTNTNGGTSPVFSNGCLLGNIDGAGGITVRMGTFQYWTGGNYDTNKFNDVKNFQLHNERWPATVNP